MQVKRPGFPDLPEHWMSLSAPFMLRPDEDFQHGILETDYLDPSVYAEVWGYDKQDENWVRWPHPLIHRPGAWSFLVKVLCDAGRPPTLKLALTHDDEWRLCVAP
jgi:hypothetical protein